MTIIRNPNETLEKILENLKELRGLACTAELCVSSRANMPGAVFRFQWFHIFGRKQYFSFMSWVCGKVERMETASKQEGQQLTVICLIPSVSFTKVYASIYVFVYRTLFRLQLCVPQTLQKHTGYFIVFFYMSTTAMVTVLLLFLIYSFLSFSMNFLACE